MESGISRQICKWYTDTANTEEIHFIATSSSIALFPHNPLPLEPAGPNQQKNPSSPTIPINHQAEHSALPDDRVILCSSSITFLTVAFFNQSGDTSSTRYHRQTIASSPACLSPPTLDELLC
ncbi:hypothetical protein TNCV_3242111 [Trichonephila clavipes]|nr:hypothetical protein TNCV_3242111 [Trichonephila clavipes]